MIALVIAARCARAHAARGFHGDTAVLHHVSRMLLGSVIVLGGARAEAAPCSQSEVDLAWAGTDLAEVSGDTGWFPSGYAAQLRFTGRVAGETAVYAGAKAEACWTESMTATVDARRNTGWLDVAYGADVHIYAKIDTSILGNAIYWEGEIPIPYLPRDLMIAASAPFDPTLDGQVDAQVADGTSPITVLSSNVIGDLIGIFGISGGLRVTVTPSMVTTYRSNAARLGDATATSATQSLAIPRPNVGFDQALDLPLAIDGVVTYAPTLTFAARFDVKILGYRVVDWEFANIPMSLAPIQRPLTLTSDTPAHFALPVLDGVGEGARMDFASGDIQVLAIKNRGEKELTISGAAVPAGVQFESLTIAPGTTGTLKVTASESAFANGSQTLRLATSDPDHAQVEIELGRDVGGTDPGMVDEPAGEGGCSTGSGAGLALGVFAPALIRRRRK